MSNQSEVGGLPSARGQSSSGGRVVVVFGGILAAAVFIGALMLLYLQWVHYENPNSTVVVRLKAQTEEVTVGLSTLGRDGRELVSATREAGSDRKLIFRVPAGLYRVTVRNAHGETLFPIRPGTGEIQARAKEEVDVVLKSNELGGSGE